MNDEAIAKFAQGLRGPVMAAATRNTKRRESSTTP